MNEREFTQKLTRQLNGAPVSSNVAQRLRSAREAAVNIAATRSASGWSRAGNALVRFWHQHHAASIGLLLALAIAVGGAGWQWRQHQVRAADRALEVQLLSDELPVDLFLSERF